MQSQYATTAQLQQLAITPAAYARFESASAGCTTAAIQSASSIADAHLTSQFELPLQISPQGWDMALVVNVCWIAAWILYNTYGFAPTAPGDDLITTRYKAALDWLTAVSTKSITPDYTDSSGAVPGDDVAGDFVISDSPVGFTSRGMPAMPDDCFGDDL